MATRTVFADQLNGGNFVGGGNDTLFLSGASSQTFDLRNTTFSGYSTIKTDASFSIIMTSAQFYSISSIEGVWYNYLHITGSTVNLVGKTLSQVWRAGIDENVTVYANDMAKIGYIDAFNAVGDTLIFSEVLSDLQRDEAHKAGYDTVIDSTGLSTTNLAPTVANLGGERKLVRPEEVVFLDAGGDATVIDDRGTIKTVTVEVDTYGDSVRILDTNRLTIDRRDDGDFYIVFDGERIGNGSRSSLNDGGLYFNFNDDAPTEAVDHVLHNIQFVRSRYSRHDTDVTVTIRDRGGKKAVADILMQGIDGPEPGPSFPTIPTIPSLPTEEFPACLRKRGRLARSGAGKAKMSSWAPPATTNCMVIPETTFCQAAQARTCSCSTQCWARAPH